MKFIERLTFVFSFVLLVTFQFNSTPTNSNYPSNSLEKDESEYLPSGKNEKDNPFDSLTVNSVIERNHSSIQVNKLVTSVPEEDIARTSTEESLTFASSSVQTNTKNVRNPIPTESKSIFQGTENTKMSNKKTEAVSLTIETEAQWKEALQKPALKTYIAQRYKLFNIYLCFNEESIAKWVGPCEAVQAHFRKLKLEHGEKIEFLIAQADDIQALEKYRNTSMPQFLFFIHNTLVDHVRGANAPLIEKKIKEHIAMEAQGVAPVPIAGAQETSTVDGSAVEQHHTSSQEKIQSAVNLSQHHHLDVESLEKTMAVLKPDAMNPYIVEQILEVLKLNRLEVVRSKKCWFTKQAAEVFYDDHKSQPFFPQLVNFLSSGPVLALVLAKEDAIQTFRQLMGPTNPAKAKQDAPKSIRALFGTDNMVNAIYGSESAESYKKLSEFIFDENNRNIIDLPFKFEELKSLTAQKTVMIIKPDITQEKDKVEDIVQRLIWRGLQIQKREEIVLSTDQVNSLYSADTHPEFKEFVSSGPALVLVIKGENAIEIVSELVGPADPEEARKSLPMSLRALHGTSMIKNAVDCSRTADESNLQTQILFPGFGARHSMSDLGVTGGSHQGSTRNVHASSNQITQAVSSEAAALPSVAEQPALTPVADSAPIQQTLALIKPDAYGAGKKDEILQRINAEGFTIVKEKEIRLTIAQAQKFYTEHEGKPFYETLTTWMSSAPIYAMVLEKGNGIAEWRRVAGPTNSNKAREESPQSIRALYGKDGSENAVHGSDSVPSATREIGIIFNASEEQPAATGTAKEETSLTDQNDSSEANPKPSSAKSSSAKLNRNESKTPSKNELTNISNTETKLPGSSSKPPSRPESGSAGNNNSSASKPGSRSPSRSNVARTSNGDLLRKSTSPSRTELAKPKSVVSLRNEVTAGGGGPPASRVIASKPSSRAGSVAGSQGVLSKSRSPSKNALSNAAVAAESSPSKPASRTISKQSLKQASA